MQNSQDYYITNDRVLTSSITITDLSSESSDGPNTSSSIDDSSEAMEPYAIERSTFPIPFDWRLAFIAGVVVFIAIISLFLLWLTFSKRRKNNDTFTSTIKDQYLTEAVPTSKGVQSASYDEERAKSKEARMSSSIDMISFPSSGTLSSVDGTGLGTRKNPKLKAIYISLPEQQFVYSKRGRQQKAAPSTTKMAKKEGQDSATKVQSQVVLKQKNQKTAKTHIAPTASIKKNVAALNKNANHDNNIPKSKTKLLTDQVKPKKKNEFLNYIPPDNRVPRKLKVYPKTVKNTM